MDLSPLANAQLDAIERLDAMAPPSAGNPHKYHEEKSDILHLLRQVHMMLTGDWRVPARPKPVKKAIEPGVRRVKGNVIQVEFRNRRSTKAGS